MVKEYDYIVIGGGSGGIASANRAAMHGVKVILFEGKEISRINIQIGKDICRNDNKRKNRQNEVVSHCDS